MADCHPIHFLLLSVLKILRALLAFGSKAEV
jgi:hypothetical protein